MAGARALGRFDLADAAVELLGVIFVDLHGVIWSSPFVCLQADEIGTIGHAMSTAVYGENAKKKNYQSATFSR